MNKKPKNGVTNRAIKYNTYRDAIKAVIGDIEVMGCFSCDKEFIAECHNDRDEGYFCDDCLDNKQ